MSARSVIGYVEVTQVGSDYSTIGGSGGPGLLDHCHIFEMNGESYRFRESMKTKKGRKAE